MPFICSEKPKCLFIRIAKTASTSIVRGALKLELSSTNTHDHFPDGWQNVFAFAFVRNPFDRLISAWHMFQKYPRRGCRRFGERPLSLDDVMRVIEDDSIDVHKKDFLGKLRRHSIPMTDPQYQLQRADFVGRFENLQADWKHICHAIGHRYAPLAHFRKSTERNHYSAYFDRRTRTDAERIFAEDLIRFNYGFEEQTQPQRHAA